MVIRGNPALEAYLDAKRSGIYSEDELVELLKDLELTERDLPLIQVTRDIEGTKPVTTLDTIEDEEFSLETPLGGPIQTTKQREANTELERQIASRRESGGESKG